MLEIRTTNHLSIDVDVENDDGKSWSTARSHVLSCETLLPIVLRGGGGGSIQNILLF
jgi:hypothetical protein